MKSFRDIPIRTKLVIIVLTITILTVLLSTGIFVFNDLKIFKKDMVRNLTVLASAVGSNSRASLLFLDQEAAANILSSLKEETQIQYAALLDVNDGVFAIYKREESTQFKPPTILEEGQYLFKNQMEIIHPIKLKEEVVGRIYLNAHMQEFKNRVKTYIIISGAIVIFTLAIALGLAIKFQAIVSNPILSLANTAKDISRTSDYSIRVKHESLDELGTLFSGFNEMLSQIEKRENELAQYREHLEEKVVECRLAGENLKKSEESTRIILDNAFDAIITMDDKGRVLSWNQRAAGIFGWHSNEIVGEKLVDKIIPHSLREAHIDGLNRFLATGEGRVLNRQIEMSALRRQGSEFPVEFTISATKHEGSFIFTGIVRDITERKRAEKSLIKSQQQLRNLSNRLQSAREEEKTRIAREIHDEFGQTLTALKLDLNWIEKNLHSTESPVLEKIEAMTYIIENTVQMVQRIASELRPRILDILGLCEALRWQTKEFQKRTGIQCDLIIDPADIDLDPERSTTFFRVYQETLTNVARHANASHVQTFFKKQISHIILEVRDNGIGIKENLMQNPQSLGLVGIRERALVWGGEVQIQSLEGEGTTITVTIPLKDP